MVVCVEPVAAKPSGVDGGRRSGEGPPSPPSVLHAAVAAAIPTFADRLRAASKASTSSRYVVLHTRPVNVAFKPPVVACAAPLRYTPYPATRTLSCAGFHWMSMLSRVTPLSVSASGVDGGVVSRPSQVPRSAT